MKREPIVVVRLLGADQAIVAAAARQLQIALGDAVIMAEPHVGRQDWFSYGSLHVDASPALPLPYVLQQLVTTARSYGGVTGDVVRGAQATLREVDAQCAAIRRILHELNDDGITDAALDAAEAVLRGGSDAPAS